MNIHGNSLRLLRGDSTLRGRSSAHALVAHRVRARELHVRAALSAWACAVAHWRIGAHRALALDASVPAHRRSRVEAGGGKTTMVPAADASAHFIPFKFLGMHTDLLFNAHGPLHRTHSGGHLIGAGGFRYM